MIVGIGELLWDVFPDGRKVAGGAPFNFAFHCQQLGHEAVIVSRVGDDDLGRELRDEVKRLGLSDEFIQTDRDHPTGTVQVSVDAQGQPSYTITENVAWDFIAWDDSVERLHQLGGAACYGSLALRNEVSRQTIDRYVCPWKPGVDPELVILDVNLRTSNTDMLGDRPFESDWLKMNDSEVNRIDNWRGDIELVMRELAHPLVVIVTRGESGCSVYTRSEAIHEPGIPARVVDTVGAGDAFTAAMVCLHLEGHPLRECARFANHYAARVCEHQGGTPRIDRAEVERAVFGSA